MEPLAFQVTFDAIDPHAQARFWAAALGWTLEVDTAFVQSMLDKGFAEQSDVVEIDGELFWATGSAIQHPAGRGDPLDGSSGSRRVLFMAVPETKQVKNRVHLDLNVGKDAVPATIERLTGLGAKVLYEIDEPGGSHTTLADPEGNELCVQ